MVAEAFRLFQLIPQGIEFGHVPDIVDDTQQPPPFVTDGIARHKDLLARAYLLGDGDSLPLLQGRQIQGLLEHPPGHQFVHGKTQKFLSGHARDPREGLVGLKDPSAGVGEVDTVEGGCDRSRQLFLESLHIEEGAEIGTNRIGEGHDAHDPTRVDDGEAPHIGGDERGDVVARTCHEGVGLHDRPYRGVSPAPLVDFSQGQGLGHEPHQGALVVHDRDAVDSMAHHDLDGIGEGRAVGQGWRIGTHKRADPRIHTEPPGLDQQGFQLPRQGICLQGIVHDLDAFLRDGPG